MILIAEKMKFHYKISVIYVNFLYVLNLTLCVCGSGFNNFLTYVCICKLHKNIAKKLAYFYVSFVLFATSNRAS